MECGAVSSHASRFTRSDKTVFRREIKRLPSHEHLVVVIAVCCLFVSCETWGVPSLATRLGLGSLGLLFSACNPVAWGLGMLERTENGLRAYLVIELG